MQYIQYYKNGKTYENSEKLLNRIDLNHQVDFGEEKFDKNDLDGCLDEIINHFPHEIPHILI